MNEFKQVAALVTKLVTYLSQLNVVKTGGELETMINFPPITNEPVAFQELIITLSTFQYDSVSKKFTEELDSNFFSTLLFHLLALQDATQACTDAYNNNLQGVKQFCETYAFFKNRNCLSGASMLYLAAKQGHLEIVKYLVEVEGWEADTYLSGSNHSTPLHSAAFNQKAQVAQYLIDNGADLNAKNDDKETPHSLITAINLLPVAKRPKSHWQYYTSKSKSYEDFSTLECGIISEAWEKSESIVKFEARKHIYVVYLQEFVRSGRDMDEDPMACVPVRNVKLPHEEKKSFEWIWQWQYDDSTGFQHITKAGMIIIDKALASDKNNAKLQVFEFSNFDNANGTVIEISFADGSWKCGTRAGFIRWIPKQSHAKHQDILSLENEDDGLEVPTNVQLPTNTSRAPIAEDKADIEIAKIVPEKSWTFPNLGHICQSVNLLSVQGKSISASTSGADLVVFALPEQIIELRQILNHGLQAPPVPQPMQFTDSFEIGTNTDVLLALSLSIHPITAFLLQKDSTVQPLLTLESKQSSYFITITGSKQQKMEVQAGAQRLWKCTQTVKSGELFITNFLNASVKHKLAEFGKILVMKKVKSVWIEFLVELNKRMIEKTEAVIAIAKNEYKNLITASVKDLFVTTTSTCDTKLWQISNNIKNNNPVLESLGDIATKALQHVLQSIQEKLPKDVNTASINALKQHTATLVSQFASCIKAGDYKKMLHVLQCIVVFTEACKQNLPLFEKSVDLIKQINTSQIVSIATGTGSGKSTLLPVLLYASGYESIAITQPRRLPCTMICSRVNSLYGSIAGWSVSGLSFNPKSPVLYVTDGLLKEWLQLALVSPTGKIPFDVIMIDEIHERGINIDLCIALLAKLLQKNPKIKIILSSATLDPVVENPFKKFACNKFLLPVPALYPIEEEAHENEEPVLIAIEKSKQLKLGEQLLVFVPSVADVHECCASFREITKMEACPLYAQQTYSAQMNMLQNGNVFFSTNIAQTSLTFPNLKFVIDTGKVNIAKYNMKHNWNEVLEEFASESTTIQRRGRLGRTCKGTYIRLYNKAQITTKFDIPDIEKIDLLDIEFSFWKAKQPGLSSVNDSLPSPLPDVITKILRAKLVELAVITSTNTLSSIGQKLTEFPNVGGVRLTLALFRAFDLNCGQDVIRLCALVMSLPNTTKALLDNIPSKFKSEDGDLQSLLNLFNAMVLLKQTSKSTETFKTIAASVGCKGSENIFEKAYLRMQQINKTFSKSAYASSAFKTKKQWSCIAEAFLHGFSDQVFYSMALLQGQKHEYVRLTRNSSNLRAIISAGSILSRKPTDDPVPCFVALSVFRSSHLRSSNLCQVGMLGLVDIKWASSHTVREFELGGIPKKIEGKACDVIAQETKLRQASIVEKTVALHTMALDEKEKKNLEKAMQSKYIFHPMIWRWKNCEQADITVQGKGEFKIKGSASSVKRIETEVSDFWNWLRMCTVFRSKESGVPPQVMKTRVPEIEARIARIAAPERLAIDVWQYCNGSKKSREHRMEAVAWVAVCKFNCRLEGGFVRDWVVAGSKNTPASPPSQWFDLTGDVPAPKEPTLVPPDLDIQLPSSKLFDINRFLDMLYSLTGMTADVVKRQGWRYILMFDVATGPFSVDLIEPHIVATHDMIDFDVSNLGIERSYDRELLLRVDTTDHDVTLDSIVQNILSKKFIQMRALDPNMQNRIKKLETRGWKLVDKILFTPNEGYKHGASYVKMSNVDPSYKQMEAAFNGIGTISKIEIVSHHNLDLIYKGMVLQVQKENNNNANEMFLFHGTKAAGVQGINESGFDNRFWSKGAYGFGAYFTNDPTYSNHFTESSNSVIFLCKVALGKIQPMTKEENDRTAPNVGFHSVHGPKGLHTQWDEYIVYRYGQAKPYLRITYKKK